MSWSPVFFGLVFVTAIVAGGGWALGQWIIGRLTSYRSREPAPSVPRTP
jgi:hypothetical protein